MSNMPMMRLDVRSNLSGIVRQLQGFQKEVAVATAKALTFTAEKVQRAQQQKMTEVFDRPTKWTINGLRLKTASVHDLSAMVYFKDDATKGIPAGKYLLPQINGGERRQKSSERRLAPFMGGMRYAIPAKSQPLDAYGNLSGAIYTRILAQVGALNRYDNETPASLKRNKKAQSERYFIPKAGSGLKPGVYKTVNGKPVMVLVFTAKASYKPRYPFYVFSEEVARQAFPLDYDQAIARELAKAFSSTPPIT